MGVRVVFPDMGKDPSIQLIEKTITENGTYEAITDGANGYSKVNVNVEGGGGGSSDFSTAKVTFVNNTVSNILSGSTALVFDEEEHSYVYGIDSLADNKSYTFILYKGLNIFQCTNTDQFTVTTSGNVTYDSENGAFLITGDCTITIS